MCAIEMLCVVRACAGVRMRAMLREASINEVLMVSCLISIVSFGFNLNVASFPSFLCVELPRVGVVPGRGFRTVDLEEG